MGQKSKTISLAGAIIAFSIGSGFATGQELMQFFASYGVWGCLGASLLAAVIFTWVCAVVLQDTERLRLRSTNSIWKYYCGDIFGGFLRYFTPVFLFFGLIIMTAGAGATLHEYYDLPNRYGRMLMVALMLGTVALGRDRLTRVLGVAGTILTCCALLIGLGSLILNAGQLAGADAVLATKHLTQAADSWWLSGLLYPGFMALTLAPFLAGLGWECAGPLQARKSGFWGGFAYSIAGLVMSYALLASADITAEADAPSLMIAKAISPFFGALFSVLLVLGIYSTAVSMLWLVCNFFHPDESSRRFKWMAALLSLVVYFCSALPFKMILNIVYPYTGYIGLGICACIFYTHYFKRRKYHPETGARL